MKMITCPHCAKEFDYAAQTETSAGTVACPHCGKSVSQPMECKDALRAKDAEAGGVWRTINGGPVFIKDGESLDSAIARRSKASAIRADRATKRAMDSGKAEDHQRAEAAHTKAVHRALEAAARSETSKDKKMRGLKEWFARRGDESAVTAKIHARIAKTGKL
jgi:hypothetical protein